MLLGLIAREHCDPFGKPTLSRQNAVDQTVSKRSGTAGYENTLVREIHCRLCHDWYRVGSDIIAPIMSGHSAGWKPHNRRNLAELRLRSMWGSSVGLMVMGRP